MRNASDQQGENEEQWKNKANMTTSNNLFLWAHVSLPAWCRERHLLAGKANVKISGGFISVQHTRIAVAFACWNFLLFLSLKTCK